METALVLWNIQNAFEIFFRIDILDLSLNIQLGRCLHRCRISGKLSHVDQLANNSCSGSHDWRHQMGAAKSSLSTFKISVRCACTPFSGRENIRVHAQAHGTSRFSPLKSSIEEDLVKA